MKSFLKNYRQSPRKVKLVADLIKGKNAEDAVLHLNFLVKRASDPLKKLLNSAISNAKMQGFKVEDLFVKECVVDKGIVMKRMMPRAMGRGARINKRTSHVSLVLGVKENKTKEKKKNKDSKKTEVKTLKKEVKKVTKTNKKK